MTWTVKVDYEAEAKRLKAKVAELERKTKEQAADLETAREQRAMMHAELMEARSRARLDTGCIRIIGATPSGLRIPLNIRNVRKQYSPWVGKEEIELVVDIPYVTNPDWGGGLPGSNAIQPYTVDPFVLPVYKPPTIHPPPVMYYDPEALEKLKKNLTYLPKSFDSS